MKIRAIIMGLSIKGSSRQGFTVKIKEAGFTFFKSKFEEPHPIWHVLKSSLIKILSEAQSSWLEVPFDSQEFTFEFIRSFWDSVGKDFIKAVKFFESHHLINPGSSSSFITFTRSVIVNRLLSINLIGCISKVVSKNKTCLGLVIGNSQTTFIKDCNILDGPLMAKKLRKQLIIFKVDFAKAFDSLNWNFLDNVLKQMEFGLKWRARVKGTISITKCSVSVNGVLTRENFGWRKGCSKGDPLAPFLFILMAKDLNVAFREAVKSKIFKGIQLDNLDEEVALFLLGISVTKDEIRRMAQWLGSKEGSFPSHIFGLPMSGNMSKVSSWQPLIEKFKSWLSIWKTKNVWIGKRLCLCKAVLGGIGNYFFLLYKAPNKVLTSWKKRNIREGLIRSSGIKFCTMKIVADWESEA
ncbi:hypothetical protein OSB04_031205 [Centaurea solstitialis]|uniref:Reverse transcriptase domain-containing protein n=1 Tax=Centaurea solstitialis TaxID=347529 RepID=A0AA38VXD7_9ASTR|nr:hypothetical protein OSB04_031205 [Centaurea solstitialis]